MNSPIPGHTTTFNQHVPGGNLGDFDDRWKWTEESMVPAFEKLVQNSSKQVRKDMDALIDQGRKAFGPIKSPY